MASSKASMSACRSSTESEDKGKLGVPQHVTSCFYFSYAFKRESENRRPDPGLDPNDSASSRQRVSSLFSPSFSLIFMATKQEWPLYNTVSAPTSRVRSVTHLYINSSPFELDRDGFTMRLVRIDHVDSFPGSNGVNPYGFDEVFSLQVCRFRLRRPL